MHNFWFYRPILFGFLYISLSSAGISPVHDFKQKFNTNYLGDKLLLNSPHKIVNHLDSSIKRSTKNVTHNPKMEETLYQISKDLISAILSKLEIQDKITRITKEALEAPGKNKGMTAIETRRILDYISRTLSGHMLSITKVSTEPELHRLVYGLAQIAAEISIVSALKDITYATTLSKRQAVDLNLRKKRSVTDPQNTTVLSKNVTERSNTIYNAILNKTENIENTNSTNNVIKKVIAPVNNEFLAPYSVIPNTAKSSLLFINKEAPKLTSTKGFLNQTALDIENSETSLNNTDKIILEKNIKGSHDVTVDPHTLDLQELSAPGLVDDWMDQKDTNDNSESADEIQLERDVEDELSNNRKTKQKLEKLEIKAKKAILHAGDVAYLTAASVVAMRRALTAAIEVKMSVKYAQSGMANHQELMMNLARTAAQQAGKEARIATSKSLACERVIKLAVKYTAQSHGANLNHVANRIVMDSLSLATLAKSMAFVSSEIAINSLYKATDVKIPVQ